MEEQAKKESRKYISITIYAANVLKISKSTVTGWINKYKSDELKEPRNQYISSKKCSVDVHYPKVEEKLVEYIKMRNELYFTQKIGISWGYMISGPCYGR